MPRTTYAAEVHTERGTIPDIGVRPAARLRRAVPTWRSAFPCLRATYAAEVHTERGTIPDIGVRPAARLRRAVPTWRSAFPCLRATYAAEVHTERGTIPDIGVRPAARLRRAVPTGGRRSKPSPRFFSVSDAWCRGERPHRKDWPAVPNPGAAVEPPVPFRGGGSRRQEPSSRGGDACGSSRCRAAPLSRRVGLMTPNR